SDAIRLARLARSERRAGSKALRGIEKIVRILERERGHASRCVEGDGGVTRDGPGAPVFVTEPVVDREAIRYSPGILPIESQILLVADIWNLLDDQRCVGIRSQQEVSQLESAHGQTGGRARSFAPRVPQRAGLREKASKTKLSFVPGDVVIDEPLVD